MNPSFVPSDDPSLPEGSSDRHPSDAANIHPSSSIPASSSTATLSYDSTSPSSATVSVSSRTTVPTRRVDHTYRDYSVYKTDSRLWDNDEFPRGKKLESNFPAVLHRILSNPDYTHIITWMPHGRSWKILDKDLLVEVVCSKFFSQSKYQSFSRQVNGWGFKQLQQEGSNFKTYYHECCLRGLPRLTRLMKRVSSNLGKSIPDKQGEPNFNELGIFYPLPLYEGGPLGRMGSSPPPHYGCATYVYGPGHHSPPHHLGEGGGEGTSQHHLAVSAAYPPSGQEGLHGPYCAGYHAHAPPASSYPPYHPPPPPPPIYNPDRGYYPRTHDIRMHGAPQPPPPYHPTPSRYEDVPPPGISPRSYAPLYQQPRLPPAPTPQRHHGTSPSKAAAGGNDYGYDLSCPPQSSSYDYGPVTSPTPSAAAGSVGKTGERRQLPSVLASPSHYDPPHNDYGGGHNAYPPNHHNQQDNYPPPPLDTSYAAMAYGSPVTQNGYFAPPMMTATNEAFSGWQATGHGEDG